MKTIKVIMVSALCTMTLFATAAPTATAKISIASASNNGNDQLILIEDPSCSSALETAEGKDIIKVMNDANDFSINLFAVSAGANLSAVGTDELKDLALTFVSNKTETDYTMSFSNVTGTIKLYDAAENKEVTLANGGSYAFTAAVNSTIEDRFVINKATIPVEFCFRNNVLTVNGHKGEKLKISKDAEGDIQAEMTLGDEFEKDLSMFTGRIAVVLDSKTYYIDANPATTLVP